MKKLFTIGIIAFLFTVLFVFAANLIIGDVTIQGQQGATNFINFTIQNTNATSPVTLTSGNFVYDPNEFKDSDDDAIALAFSLPVTINAGSSANVTVTANVDNNVDQGTYSDTVTVTNGIFSDTFVLKVVVNPDICEDGIIGDLRFTDWELKENPETDEKDEYYPGDKIVVQDINVENFGDDEITDVVVEAILYDLSDGDELEGVKSDSFNLNDGDDKDVEDLEFEVPLDADEDNDFAVFVKIYEDGEEDKNCGLDSMSVDVKKRSRDMKIDLTSINPAAAKCGDSVNFNVNVKNTGSKDDSSVYVKIQDPALKIVGQTASFSLDSDEDTSKTVTIKLPEDLDDSLYSIEAVVVYAGTTPRSDFGNLTVTCEADNKAPVANAGATQTADANSIVTLNGASSSDADADQLTSLWTQTSGLAVQLSSPTSAVTTFTPTSPDTYVFKIDVSDGKLTSSAVTTVVVRSTAATGATTYQPTSIADLLFKKDSLQKGAWIMAILIMALIAVFLLKLIISPGKPKVQETHNIAPKPEFPE